MTLRDRSNFPTELSYLVYLSEVRHQIDSEFRLAARRFTNQLRRDAANKQEKAG